MDFVFTETFYAAYQDLSDDRAEIVDQAIRRLLVDHASGWARQGRIEDDKRGSWIITASGHDFDVTLYWDYHNDADLILLALLVRDR